MLPPEVISMFSPKINNGLAVSIVAVPPVKPIKSGHKVPLVVLIHSKDINCANG